MKKNPWKNALYLVLTLFLSLIYLYKLGTNGENDTADFIELLRSTIPSIIAVTLSYTVYQFFIGNNENSEQTKLDYLFERDIDIIRKIDELRKKYDSKEKIDFTTLHEIKNQFQKKLDEIERKIEALMQQINLIQNEDSKTIRRKELGTLLAEKVFIIKEIEKINDDLIISILLNGQKEELEKLRSENEKLRAIIIDHENKAKGIRFSANGINADALKE